MIEVQDAIALCNQRIKFALQAPGSALQEITAYLSQNTGKGVRPLLLITAAANLEGKVPEDVHIVAAALEILHMGTLVHDDVMDNALARRGMMTVHKKFDVKTAVICGDYLLSISLSMLADMDRQRLETFKDHIPLGAQFTKALSNVCKGEYAQHVNIGNLDMDVFTYLKIIYGKTASLFFVAAHAGAILGGNESVEGIKAIGRFGRCLGMVFQIADDCKDYEWSEDMAKKPVTNDIKTGVITLPLILALQKDLSLREASRQAMENKKDLRLFIQALQNSGGLKGARALAKRYAVLASQALRNISPHKKEALLSILNDIKGVEPWS